MKRRKLAGRGMPSTLGAMLAVFLLVLAALAGGCGGGEQSSGPSEEEAAEQEAAGQETEPAEIAETTQPADSSAASIDETVSVGAMQWSVTDAEQLEGLVSRMGNEEGSFVMVDVTFVNGSNQDITFATPFITLLDSEGREFEADIESNFTHLDPELNFFVDPVEPGTTKEGRILFAVDPNSSGFRLQVGEARFAAGETGYVDLGF